MSHRHPQNHHPSGVKPKSVIRVYGRLVFVPSILVASLAKLRKASSECLSATARQGCGQDAGRNAEIP